MTHFFVLGLGKSGLATARFLKEHAHVVSVWDDSPDKRLLATEEGFTVEVPEDFSLIDTFVLSPGIPHTYPAPHPIVQKAKTQGCQPLSDISLFFRFFPNVRAIGITGTNGKSTTCSLLKHTLEAQGVDCIVAGNFGIPIFSIIEPEKLYILELSSYQLEISPLLPLYIGVILHVVPHHLERYGNVEAYAKAKIQIFSQATHCLLGKDRGIDLTPYLEGKVVQDIHAHDLITSVPFLPHNRENAAMAKAIATLLGKEEDTFDSFRGLSHRQEYVGCFGGIHYINDSKATSPEAVVEAIKNITEGQVFWIAGGVVQLDDLTPLLPVLPRISMAFLIGQATERYATFLEANGVHYVRSLTLTTALTHATEEAQRAIAPSILLSPGCASFDQFRDFEQRGELFCSWVYSYWQASRVLG